MLSPLEYAERIAYSSKEVLRFTYDQAVKYKDSPGVYVECGVAAGAQIIAMFAGAPNKTIYAFDSFEGIPLPSNKDDQMPGIAFLSKAEQKALPDPGKQALKSSGATVVPVKDFWKHIGAAFGREPISLHDGLGIYFMTGFDLKVRQGWFEEVIPEIAPLVEPISILRLDSDLYNSTYVCLKYLYPKVIEGGLVIVDDFALPGCKQAVKDYWRDADIKIPYVHTVENNKDSTVIFWIK